MIILDDTYTIGYLIEKNIRINLQNHDIVEGRLVGFDQFLNLVVDESVTYTQKKSTKTGIIIIRGNNVVSIEELESN